MRVAGQPRPEGHQKGVHRAEGVPNHGIPLMGVRHWPIASRCAPEEGWPQAAMHGRQLWLPPSRWHHVRGQHLHSHGVTCKLVLRYGAGTTAELL